MLIDSHCHLDRIDLSAFNQDLSELLRLARLEGVEGFLSVCIRPEDMPGLIALAERFPQVWISAGVHPTEALDEELSTEALQHLAAHPSCIAIGETGLDYFHSDSEDNKILQQARFRRHIQVSKQLKKPLIIHTRQAAEDTLRIMREEKADEIGGVMHCFTEDWSVAEQALDLNFYISLSGILTFKSAEIVQSVAKRLPQDRFLIETDSPYLAPMPFRGKQNHPALVKYVALKLAELRGMDFNDIALASRSNFYRCFRLEA